MCSSDLFQTKYVMWSNFDMEKQDKNLAAYQMAAEVFDRLDIHEGTLFNYHQTRKGTRNYQVDLQALQYDMLYGERYVYEGETPYEATDIQLGTYLSTFDSIQKAGETDYIVTGSYFTASSRLEVNGELQETILLSPERLMVQNLELKDGDVLDVAIQSNSSTKRVLTRTDKKTYRDEAVVAEQVVGPAAELTEVIQEEIGRAHV